MKTIVVNGANGYVASNFVADLLKNGYKVIALVRPNNRLTAEERMHSVLSDISEYEKTDTGNLSVYTYSLLEKNFAISKKRLENIFGTDVDYFHFAASLKYDKKSANEIFATNIDGVKNSVLVFNKYASASSRFFYIGTAYSCGKFSGVFEEKFYKNKSISAFRNYYELSKRFAENIIKQSIEKQKLNGHVIRLSQVVGNHKTGVTKTDYGIFDFAKRVSVLARRYPDEVVRVHVDPDSTQNLIPVDTVVKYLNQTVKLPEVPVIMNFVSKKSIKNSFIINTLNDLLPITMIPLKKIERDNMNSIERLISIGMSFTESYVETNIIFDTKKRGEIIPFSEEFEITEESVLKMLKYYTRNYSENKKVIFCRKTFTYGPGSTLSYNHHQ